MGLAGFAFGFMLSLAFGLGLMQAGAFVDGAEKGDPATINGPGHTHEQHVHLPGQKHRHNDHLHKPGQQHEHWAERAKRRSGSG